MSPLAVALVVAVSSTIGPLFLAHLTGRQRLAEKREEAAQRLAEKHEDWRRQDEVEARLLKANQVTVHAVEEVRELVNGNLTAAMQSDLSSLRGQLALMQKMTALTGEVAKDPSIEVIEDRISELSAQLEDRHAAQQRIDPSAPGTPP